MRFQSSSYVLEVLQRLRHLQYKWELQMTCKYVRRQRKCKQFPRKCHVLAVLPTTRKFKCHCHRLFWVTVPSGTYSKISTFFFQL